MNSKFKILNIGLCYFIASVHFIEVSVNLVLYLLKTNYRKYIRTAHDARNNYIMLQSLEYV